MITSFAAGSTAIVVSLPGWGVATLDSNQFVHGFQLPISSEQAKDVLKTNTTAGVSWITYVEDAMSATHASTSDSMNIAYNGAFWPIGSPIWNFVQTTLANALGGFTNQQLADLQTQAAANRS